MTSVPAADVSPGAPAGAVVHLFGPVGVELNGVRLRVGGMRERAVLAALALSPEHPVSVDRLIYWVWAEDPPRAARKSLQNAVMRLRRAVEPAGVGVETVGQAYRLRLGPARLAPLDSAVDEPLAHIGDTPAMASARTHLVELHLTTIERRLAGTLTADPQAAALQLGPVVVRHPLREPLWELLIRAHFAAGRQDEALQTFRRARAALREGLGVEPGPRLLSLHAAVLAQDSAGLVDAAAAARAQLANGIAQAQLGDVAAARTCLTAAVRAATQLLADHPSADALNLLADAAAELAGEAEWIVGDAAVEAILEDVRARLGSPPTDPVRAGRLETGLALLRAIRNDARAQIHAANALALTSEAPPRVRTAALVAGSVVAEGPDDVDTRERNGLRLIEHGRDSADVVALALGHHYIGWAALERGDARAATVQNESSLRAAATTAHPHLSAQAADTRFLTALMAGRFADATALADELGAAWQRSADPGTAFLVEVSARLLLGELTDGIDALLPHFARIRAVMPGEVMWVLADALAHALAGREADASGVVDTLTAAQLRGIPRATTWTGNVTGMAHIADLCHRPDLAAIVLDHLQPLTGLHIVCGAFAYRGSVAHWQGVCLRETGRRQEAEQSLRSALAEHERVDSPPWVAQSLYALGTLLVSDRARRDADEGRRYLDRARAIAGDLGMTMLQNRIAAVASYRAGSA